MVRRRGRATTAKLTRQFSNVGRQPQLTQTISMSKSWGGEEGYKCMNGRVTLRLWRQADGRDVKESNVNSLSTLCDVWTTEGI